MRELKGRGNSHSKACATSSPAPQREQAGTNNSGGKRRSTCTQSPPKTHCRASRRICVRVAGQAGPSLTPDVRCPVLHVPIAPLKLSNRALIFSHEAEFILRQHLAGRVSLQQHSKLASSCVMSGQHVRWEPGAFGWWSSIQQRGATVERWPDKTHFSNTFVSPDERCAVRQRSHRME